jgi:C-terminal processing protease CtpA/Prc
MTTRKRIISVAIAIVILITAQTLGCRLPSPSSPTSPPTDAPLPTLTPVPEPTTPALTAVPSSGSLLDTDEPYLITGDIPYTSPFFVWGLGDSFVLLEDQAGFVNRDFEFEFALAGQVLGPIETDEDDNVSYTLLLPAIPRGTYVDVDNDGTEDTGVQVFAAAYWPNIWGDTFLEERDGTGWSSAHASTITDADREYEIEGGILIVWAPDDQQAFPTGFGDDEMLFTDDDPTAPIPAGYNIVDLDEEPFRVYKEPQPKIDLYEGDFEVSDYSEMGYEEAFDALLTQMSEEYAFTEEKGIDWDALRSEFAPRAASADTEQEFYTVVRDLTWAIPDGHIGISGGPSISTFFAEQGGSFGLILTELSDGRVIVTDVLPDLPGERTGIQVGAEIVAWNGTPVSEAIDQAVPYFGPFSTGHTRRLEQVIFLTRTAAGEEVNVTFRNPSAGTQEVTMAAEPEVDSLLAAWASADLLAPPIDGQILEDTGLGYIRIWTFSGDYKMMTDLWTYYMEEMIENDVPGLIIDMRVNGGGSSALSNNFPGFFFDEEITLAYWWRYSALEGEFVRWDVPERIEPASMHYDGPVAILVGPDCVSACEGFTYAMTQQERALVVGHYPSAGAYGGVGRGQVTLPDDMELQFPTTKTTTPDGEVIVEGVGVVPDVVVPVTEESALGLEDAVLNAAIEMLLE